MTSNNNKYTNICESNDINGNKFYYIAYSLPYYHNGEWEHEDVDKFPYTSEGYVQANIKAKELEEDISSEVNRREEEENRIRYGS